MPLSYATQNVGHINNASRVTSRAGPFVNEIAFELLWYAQFSSAITGVITDLGIKGYVITLVKRFRNKQITE